MFSKVYRLGLSLGFVVFSLVSLQAQSFTTDSSAVYNFRADMDKEFNPRKVKDPFARYFNLEQLDFIYSHFMNALQDSSGLKVYPVERLMKLKGKPKTDYPLMMKGSAVKSKKASYYIAISMEFQRGGETSLTDNTTIKIGSFGKGKDIEKLPLKLKTQFEIYDAKGKKVQKFTTNVTSKKPIGLVKDKAIIMNEAGISHSITEDTLDEFIKLIQEGAFSVSEKLLKGK
ncbi:hypothetical protein EP331_15955 [bacterium]|nr:MAG: hypothetical protein EP331_15955 [bacterium]